MKLDRPHIKEVHVWHGRPGTSLGPIRTVPCKHPETHITLSVLFFMSVKWDGCSYNN